MLHRAHAILHAATPKDWILDTHHSAHLACGFSVQFRASLPHFDEAYYRLEIHVRSSLEETWSLLEACVIDRSALAYNSFFLETWQALQRFFFYEELLLLYRRLQQALVAQGLSGTWMVLMLHNSLSLQRINDDGSDEALPSSILPADLVEALMVYQDDQIAPFGPYTRALVGEFACVLPSCHHERLKMLSDA